MKNHYYNNTSDDDDDVKHKYQKHRRTRRQENNRRIIWSMVTAGFGALCLMVYVATDHRNEEERRHDLNILRRANQFMDARRDLTLNKEVTTTAGTQKKFVSTQKIKTLVPQQATTTTTTNTPQKIRMLGDDNQDSEILNKDKAAKLFQKLDSDVTGNRHGGIRWIQNKLLKELPGQPKNTFLVGKGRKKNMRKDNVEFNVKRNDEPPMAWEIEWEKLSQSEKERGPKVDYTSQDLYKYPDITDSPPDHYPFLEPMNVLFSRWPQDELDRPPSPIIEQLMHFDYSNPKEQAMAKNFRDAGLPFKVYNVLEITAAGKKWTDEYVSSNFDREDTSTLQSGLLPRSKGYCQESHDNFFAFFQPYTWQTSIMGPPLYRNNDWTYSKWSTHARYADATSLSFDQPHFYWQSGVSEKERHEPKSNWTFISRDLSSFSATEESFLLFQPNEQKGIQCRFGERGVTAATHYDVGQNMVAMVTGAKRYILSPPKECSKLGIVTEKRSTLYRHSLLNFGHISHLETSSSSSEEMPEKERDWLERSKTALAVETVLKAGEVLFIPSHWFHYIVSLQKSAQCNARSGENIIGTENYGGARDVHDCV